MSQSEFPKTLGQFPNIQQSCIYQQCSQAPVLSLLLSRAPYSPSRGITCWRKKPYSTEQSPSPVSFLQKPKNLTINIPRWLKNDHNKFYPPPITEKKAVKMRVSNTCASGSDGIHPVAITYLLLWGNTHLTNRHGTCQMSCITFFTNVSSQRLVSNIINLTLCKCILNSN